MATSTSAGASRPFVFHSAGRELRGTLVLPDRSQPPCVLLCHGFGSYDDDIGAYARMAEKLAVAGVASLRFSFSGSDPYPDKRTIRPASEWVFDAVAALRALEQTGEIDTAHMGLLGLSIGGGVVVQVAALCPEVRCVVALAPVADGYAWLQHRWVIVHGEAAWEEFVARVTADARRVAAAVIALGAAW